MTFMNTVIEHDLSDEAKAWIEEEKQEQEERFAKIDAEMKALAPKREEWYQDFFLRLVEKGFNHDGDERIKIKPEDLPVKPEGREDIVIWKYGVDEE